MILLTDNSVGNSDALCVDNFRIEFAQAIWIHDCELLPEIHCKNLAIVQELHPSLRVFDPRIRGKTSTYINVTPRVYDQ